MAHKIIVLVPYRYITPPVWLKEETILLFKLLDDYINKLYNHDVEFFTNLEPAPPGIEQREYDLWLTQYQTPHPSHVGVFWPDGWYDPVNKSAQATIGDILWFDRWYYFSEKRKREVWQEKNGSVISHEIAGHLMKLSLGLPDNTHDTTGQNVYLDRNLNDVGENGDWEVVFQRL